MGWAPASEDGHYDNNFVEWLNATGRAGTDGTGGLDSDPRTRRVYAGAAALDTEGKRVAYMHCKVPGRQTVPRAELTALIRTLRCIRTVRRWTIYIDAQYVINGISTDDKSYYLLGRNGDLWQEVFDEIEKLTGEGSHDVNFVKVKSHVKTQAVWDQYNMTEEMYVYNELADAAAEIASNKYTKFSTLKQDSDSKHEVEKIARRIAAIEVSTWKEEADFSKYHGKSFDKL